MFFSNIKPRIQGLLSLRWIRSIDSREIQVNEESKLNTVEPKSLKRRNNIINVIEMTRFSEKNILLNQNNLQKLGVIQR